MSDESISALAFSQVVKERIRDETRALFGSQCPTLESIEYHLDGGKGIRARLPLLVAQHYGVDPERVVALAAACEVIHGATLAHDDLQDRDELRRGKPSAWRRFSEARAINLGDALIILAYHLLDTIPASADARLRAIRRLSAVCARSIDGQERELLARELPVAEVTVERILAIAEGKTSALFELPLATSAELCGASEKDLTSLERTARYLGRLFQIQDDVRDFMGLKEGRAALSDLVEGKRSVLVAIACSRLPARKARALLDFLDLPRDAKTPASLEEQRATLHETIAPAQRLLETQIRAFRGELARSLEPLGVRIERLFLGAVQRSRAPEPASDAASESATVPGPVLCPPVPG